MTVSRPLGAAPAICCYSLLKVLERTSLTRPDMSTFYTRITKTSRLSLYPCRCLITYQLIGYSSASNMAIPCEVRVHMSSRNMGLKAAERKAVLQQHSH